MRVKPGRWGGHRTSTMSIDELGTSILMWLQGNLPGIAALIAATFAVLGILSALEAILKTRTAQGAVAWSIVLVGLPIVFVPLYWIFGRRKFRGYAIAKRGDTGAIDALVRELGPHYAELETFPCREDHRLSALSRLSNLPFCRGNSATLLVDGEQAFAEIFDRIRAAKRYVLLEFYIVRDDAIGRELAALLTEKVRQGVAVYFIYDEIGSLKLPRPYLQKLRDVGVQIVPFNSTKGTGNRLQLNFRNHRKIVVCDGDYAMIGGMNIGDEYRHMHPVLTPWRDTGLAMRGPVVQAVQLSFAEDWYWATESLPPLNWTPTVSSDADMQMLMVGTGPADNVESCALFFESLIHQARERLWIVSPYFVPDVAIIHALQLAAMRGVDVRIMLPELADKHSIKLSSFTAIRETLPQGVQFYYYQRGFLHQKVLLVDDDIASVGTANLDNRSFRLNFEISAVIYDQDFAQELADMLQQDFQLCRQLLPAEVAKWSLLRRLLSRCAYLFAPLQ